MALPAIAAPIIGRVLAGVAVRTIGGLAGSAVTAMGGAVTGISRAFGALSNVAEEASKQKDESESNVIYVNFGMAGSAGKQKIAGSGKLSSKPSIARPQVSEKMPTEKLLDVAVEYLTSIDNTLKAQLESDRIAHEQQKKDAREAAIEDKSAFSFSSIRDRLSGLKSAAKKAPGLISSLAKYALILGAAAGAIGSALDDSQIARLRENIERFKDTFQEIASSITNLFRNPEAAETASRVATPAGPILGVGAFLGTYIARDISERVTGETGSSATPSGSPATQVTGTSPTSNRTTNVGGGSSAVTGNTVALDAIAKAEGTYSTGYNTSLGYGAYLPGGREMNLTDMTLSQILELQRGMLNHPNNRFNSSALGRYQIVSTTLRGAARSLGMNLETTKFNQITQDRMAMWIVENQGLDAWTGFRRYPDLRATAERALSGGASNVTESGRPNLLDTFTNARQSVTGGAPAGGAASTTNPDASDTNENRSMLGSIMDSAARMVGALGSGIVGPRVARSFSPSTPNVSERINADSMRLQNDLTLGIQRTETRDAVTSPVMPGTNPGITEPARSISSLDPNYRNIETVARYLAHFRLAA